MKIELLPNLPSDSDLASLVRLLVECVHAGASIGFLAPLREEEARGYWQKILLERETGARAILVWRDDGGSIGGSAQLALEVRANGRHRAEVQKVMVLPSLRRQGIASNLMREIELLARSRKRTLLILDTSRGHSGAVEFYNSLGYELAGSIPDFAADPHGMLEPNVIFYKRLL